MAVNPILTPLPADLPTNWETGQTVAPNGSDVGLAEQYGYNYQSQQINAAQQAINTIGTAFENLYGNADTVPVSNGGTGSTTPQTALVNLGAASNPNLLDNWYFVGGGTYGNLPINQRGVSGTISSTGYFIDRWNLTAGSVEITSAGLVLNGTISQILETAPNVSNFTATALTTTGIIEAQYDSESKTFSITSTGQTFIAAKLEIGEIQTIAYQNSESEWVLNSPPPNYQQELAKCQYYYRVITNTSSVIGAGYKYNTNQFIIKPIGTAPMRVNPTIVDNSTGQAITNLRCIYEGAATTESNPAESLVCYTGPYGISMGGTVGGSGTMPAEFQTVIISANLPSQVVALNADL